MIICNNKLRLLVIQNFKIINYIFKCFVGFVCFEVADMLADKNIIIYFKRYCILEMCADRQNRRMLSFLRFVMAIQLNWQWCKASCPAGHHHPIVYDTRY